MNRLTGVEQTSALAPAEGGSSGHTASGMQDEIAFAAMKLPEFAAWLRSQPSDRDYTSGPQSEICPIACYSGHPAAARMCGMPRWASRFIDIFDDAFDAPRTQAHALLVLARVEAEALADEETSK